MSTVEFFRDVPEWVISVATIVSMYKAWLAEKHAAVAVAKIEEVRHETNSMREQLERNRLQEGIAQGRAALHKEIQAGKVAAADSQQEAVDSAKAAADIRKSDSSYQKGGK